MLSIRKERYSGTMKGGAKKRLTKALTLMAQASKEHWVQLPDGRMLHHHLSFITLTIASLENLTASEAYTQLLAPFLQWLRDTKKVKCYVWKCEKQKRGQIHYHIVIPDFIWHEEIRKKWNALQRKAGILENWAKQHGHYKPPSTEIREKKASEAKYMVKDIIKEMAKAVDEMEMKIRDEINQDIAEGRCYISPVDYDYCYELEVRERLDREINLDGKVWDCSDNLSRGHYFTVQATESHFERLKQIADTLIFKQDDFFSIITFTDTGPPGILCEFERKAMDLHLHHILNPETCN